MARVGWLLQRHHLFWTDWSLFFFSFLQQEFCFELCEGIGRAEVMSDTGNAQRMVDKCAVRHGCVSSRENLALDQLRISQVFWINSSGVSCKPLRKLEVKFHGRSRRKCTCRKNEPLTDPSLTPRWNGIGKTSKHVLKLRKTQSINLPKKPKKTKKECKLRDEQQTRQRVGMRYSSAQIHSAMLAGCFSSTSTSPHR